MSRTTPPAQGAQNNLTKAANDIINVLNNRFSIFGEIVMSPEEQSVLRSASGTPSVVATPTRPEAITLTSPTALQLRQTP